MTLYLTDSQKDLTIKAILSEINYHQQKINSWVELYRKLQTEQNSHKHSVGGPASASVSEGEQLGNEGSAKSVCDGDKSDCNPKCSDYPICFCGA